MKQCIFLLLLCIGIYIHSNAQSGSLAGSVTDEQQQPIVGVLMTLKNNNTKTIATAITDDDGKFLINKIDAGKYQLIAKYAGYQTKLTTNIIVKPGKQARINIQMYHELRFTPPVVAKNEEVRQDAIDISSAQTREHKRATISGARVSNAPQSIVFNCFPPPIPPKTNRISQNESYAALHENDFMNVRSNPLSTLAVDVDRASYSIVRRYINQGQMPPADAIRVEEMINYFHYNYPEPEENNPINVITTLTSCPWNDAHQLLHIGLQTKTIAPQNLPPSNLVFLIDVSGSMNTENRLPLVQSSLKMLIKKLRAKDQVAIVVYAGNAGLVLPPTSGAYKSKIINAINKLQAGGSTAGGAGIQLAYKIAKEHFIYGGNNRIILATDGDFNVGVSNDNELENLITKERKSGVFLTCLGYGMGNYKDSKLETLADKGNGNYAYIDNALEAEKTLVHEYGGTMFTIAKDVKAQIEFNPKYVQSYRLVGYENRLLNEEDFKDDKKDAGEMGSGHQVTMLYEVVPAGTIDRYVRRVDPLKYQQRNYTIDDITEEAKGELATIKFRYKKPAGNRSAEIVHTIFNHKTCLQNCNEDVQFASSVALFGMLLRQSPYVYQGDYNLVLNLAQQSRYDDEEGYRVEFIRLVRTVSRTWADN